MGTMDDSTESLFGRVRSIFSFNSRMLLVLLHLQDQDLVMLTSLILASSERIQEILSVMSIKAKSSKRGRKWGSQDSPR